MHLQASGTRVLAIRFCYRQTDLCQPKFAAAKYCEYTPNTDCAHQRNAKSRALAAQSVSLLIPFYVPMAGTQRTVQFVSVLRQQSEGCPR